MSERERMMRLRNNAKQLERAVAVALSLQDHDGRPNHEGARLAMEAVYEFLLAGQYPLGDVLELLKPPS